MKLVLVRYASPAALAISLIALVFSMTGDSDAGPRSPGASTKPRPFGLLKLNRRKQFPASAIPKVRSARRADRLGGQSVEDLTDNCGAITVDLGTFCIMAATVALTNEEVGKNNYFFASQRCVELGGYLPTAAQLIGAAPRIALASTIDDSELTASVDNDATDGRRDRREMSSTLITTQAGSSAAGSQGVTEGSRGDPKQGEPDPPPQPANPSPETLQYVTVYDNRNQGGFAGGRPVSQAELFRCAFNKRQGPAQESG